MSIDLTRLKNKIDEANRYAGMYSPAETMKARDEINRMRDGSYRAISSEAIRNLDRSAFHLQNTNNAIREKKQKYINSFDSSRLAVELSIASALIGVAIKSGIDKAEVLSRLASDVKASGDKHKAKALYELLPGAISSAGGVDEALKINHIQASLESCITEKIPSEDDKQKVFQAHEEYRIEANSFRQVASLLGVTDVEHPLATSEMAKAFQRYEVRANEFGLPDIVELKK